MPAQRRLDFTQLNAKAANADLILQSPAEFDLAVWQKTAAFACAKDPVVRFAGEGVDDKALGGEIFIVKIAARHVGTPHPDLPELADTGEMSVRVRDQQLDVLDAPPAGRHFLPLIVCFSGEYLVTACPLGLGRCIKIDDLRRRHQSTSFLDVAQREQITGETKHE